MVFFGPCLRLFTKKDYVREDKPVVVERQVSKTDMYGITLEWDQVCYEPPPRQVYR